MTATKISLLAAMLAIVTGPSPVTQSFSVSSGGVHVTVRWTTKIFMEPGDTGPSIPVNSIRSATATFTGTRIVTSRLSLNAFESPFAHHDVEWVKGPREGCGAATRAAFLTSKTSAPPYVVFFTVLGEKGCLPMALLFMPVRSAGAWRYEPAPSYREPLGGHWPFVPVATFRPTNFEPLALPSATGGDWAVWLYRGTISGKPAAVVLDFTLRKHPLSIYPGEVFILGRQADMRTALIKR